MARCWGRARFQSHADDSTIKPPVLADYVVFLYLSELIEHGPTETIFTEPNDPRTKAYIEGAFG
jgi:ABC-type phosphate transport system ATPase subunit